MAKTAKAKPKGRKAQARQSTGKKTTKLVLGSGAAVAAVVVVIILVVSNLPHTVKAAPSWQATSIDGEKLVGKSWKGDVYAVDFFFTWCPICAQQFPHKKTLVEHFADRKDFHFVSISVDPGDTPAKLDEYRRSHGATWPYVSDKFGLLEAFQPTSRPFIVFVDRDGNIAKTITKITEGSDLIELAQSLLDKPVTPSANQTANNTTVAASMLLLVAPARFTRRESA